MARLVYHWRYNLGFPGLNWLHPFDIRKYGRAYRALQKATGQPLRERVITVDRPVTDQELQLVHSKAYLASLGKSAEVAKVVEIPLLSRVPHWMLRPALVMPVRWAARGTVLAAHAALKHGLGINLGGGFHHAKRDRGEGFCLFSDIALAVRQLRAEGMISQQRKVAYIDLDAHQGNGVCHQFMDDNRVFIFDMYNQGIYPSYDLQARERIDCDLPLPANCTGGEYLSILRTKLPGFLDSISRAGETPLGIYNAGTDVVQGDPLGMLEISANDVTERDCFVVNEFTNRGIPLVMVTSGGYTGQSYRLIADSVAAILAQTQGQSESQ